MKRKIKVCTIEYETNDSVNWKAVILAYSIDDAVRYIIKKVNGYRKLVSTSVDKEVDAIDEAVYNDYFVSIVENVVDCDKTPETKPQKVTKPADIVEENVSASLKNGEVECPECGKICKSQNGLRIHANKSHSKK